MKRAKGGLKQVIIDLSKHDLSDLEEESIEELAGYVGRAWEGVRVAKRSQEYNKGIETSKRPAVNQEFWDDKIEYAESIGIDLIGFTEVDEYFIFEEEPTNYNVKDNVLDNAIVLGMEMKRDKIDQAPNPAAGIEAYRVYADLGEATNKLAQYIRNQGFQAQAFHPLWGPVLYPPIAQKAGLGKVGINGLLITSEFGPRLRLSMIATDASPLPSPSQKDLEIKEYCKECNECVEECPGQAIFSFNEKIELQNGRYIQNIDPEKCFPHFFNKTGCSICIKVCPFSKQRFGKTI